MKFQNCILMNIERTEGRTEAQNNMPLQLFQSLGHKFTTAKSLRKNNVFLPLKIVVAKQSATPQIVLVTRACAFWW